MTRSYEQYCPVAVALDVIGERWTMLIIRDLLIGPKRYTDLQEGLPGISPNILAERLRELETHGVVAKRKLPPPAPSVVYELTEHGRSIEPILTQLATWGMPMLGPPDPEHIASVDPFVLGLKLTFRADLAGDLDETYEIRLGEHAYTVVVGKGELEVRRGEAPNRAVAISTDPVTWARIGMEGASIAGEARKGKVRVDGPAAALKRFAKLFSLAA